MSFVEELWNIGFVSLASKQGSSSKIDMSDANGPYFIMKFDVNWKKIGNGT